MSKLVSFPCKELALHRLNCNPDFDEESGQQFYVVNALSGVLELSTTMFMCMIENCRFTVDSTIIHLSFFWTCLVRPIAQKNAFWVIKAKMSCECRLIWLGLVALDFQIFTGLAQCWGESCLATLFDTFLHRKNGAQMSFCEDVELSVVHAEA